MFTYFLETIPNFLLYFAVSILMLMAFAFAYVKITPHEELKLIRNGNMAAAISLGGALIGFVLGLGTVIRHAASIPDLLLWGIVVFLIQLAAFHVAKLYMGERLDTRIEQDCTSTGVFVASISVAVGLLNSACMTP